MAKAGDKSSTSDKVSTEKASIAERDEEIAGLFAELFKPKSRKTRSTDERSVKEARRQSLRTAIEKHKAGHRAAHDVDIAPEKPERRALLDREREQRGRLFETAPADDASSTTDPDQYAAERVQYAAERVIEAGLHAGEQQTQAVGRGERSREYFRRLAELLDLVGGNEYPLPKGIVKQLAKFCRYLGDGIIPGPIKHCALQGRPLGPDE